MAGDFAIAAPFRKTDYDLLIAAKLDVTVLVDLSHNANTTTTLSNKPGAQQIIQKAVGLDIAIGKGTAAPADFLSLKNAKTSSAAYQIYEGLAKLGGLDRLTNKANAKVEAPNYDKSVVDPTQATLAGPWKAATAASAAAFNLLDTSTRKSMGMYQWKSDKKSYALSGQQATDARIAP